MEMIIDDKYEVHHSLVGFSESGSESGISDQFPENAILFTLAFHFSKVLDNISNMFVKYCTILSAFGNPIVVFLPSPSAKEIKI